MTQYSNSETIESLNNFLFQYKSTDEATHLSFVGGKWLIPNDKLDQFYKYYYACIKNNDKLHIIEKINKNEVFKLFFDIEIPKGKLCKESNFNSQSKLFIDLVEIITNVSKDFFTNKSPPTFEYIITERRLTKNISKIHLNFSNLNVNSLICEGIIKKVNEYILENELFDLMGLIDTSVYNTGLRLFKSNKSSKDNLKEIEFLKEKDLYNSSHYEICYNYKKELNQNIEFNYDVYKKLIVKTTNKKISDITESSKEFLLKNKKIEKKQNTNNIEIKTEIKKSIDSQLNRLLEFLPTLPIFKNYDLGCVKKLCLTKNSIINYFITCNNNICPFKERVHKRASNPVYLLINNKGITMKCYDQECSNLCYPQNGLRWDSINDIKNEIAELYSYIQVKYVKTEISDKITNTQRSLLENSIERNGTHFSIAKVSENIYSNFRVDKIDKPDWYHFDGIRFIKNEKIDELLSSDLVNYYNSMKINDTSKFMDITDFINNESSECSNNSTIDKITIKLEDTNFKRLVKSQLATILYNKDLQFYEKLNENPYLICFNNGVYDLKKCEFRMGKEEDYITFTTKYDYQEYDPENENVKEIMEFLQKIIPKKDVLEYLLHTLGRGLDGNTDEKFYIWTGITGANGKSTLSKFIKKTLGDYHSSPDISLLTEKRKIGASPELYRCKGKRFLIFQEPEKQDKLKTGKMKQYSGKDEVETRELYKSPISFENQGTMIVCCNELLEIDASDGGTWRRIRVIKFISKFTDNPKKGLYEYEIDSNMDEKLDKWKSYFMGILLHYYKKCKENNFKIKEPKEVLEATKKYKEIEDIYNTFFTQKIERTDKPNEYIKQSDVYTFFCEDWIEKNKQSKWTPKQKDVFNALTRIFNIEPEFDIECGENVYYGLTYKN